MSSEEDFHSTPNVRQTAEMARGVRPYMFEPLARPLTPVDLESSIESSDDSDSQACDSARSSPVRTRNALPQERDLMTVEDEDEARPVCVESSELELEWCICGSCREMASEVENVCCRSIKKVRDYIPTDLLCMTDCAGFRDNCLNSNVLDASRWEYMEQHGPFGDEQPLNKTFRYLAYRRFVYLVWHRLGHGKRKVLSACVATSIKETFPDAHGTYVGFRAAR